MFEGSSGKVALISNDALDRQSLKSVLLTNIGELMGDPSYGSDLKSCLFEIESPLFQKLLQESISQTANKWVNGVTISSVKIDISEDATECNKIVVYYYSKSTGENNIISLEVNNNGKLSTI